jgi:uncharacterized protein YcfJ
MEIAMNAILKTALAAAVLGIATQASAEVVFYEHDNYGGRTFTARGQVANFTRYGFNDLASSVVVLRDRWEVCVGAQFRDGCIVLRPGRYPSLSSMGLNDRISSVRMVAWNSDVRDERYAPVPAPVYNNSRRGNERLYDAQVVRARAVVGQNGQRCWMEREQVSDERNGPNVGGAVLGAILGGVLGHQVGGGRGNDVATGVGALAGGAIGANSGRGNYGQNTTTRDVQRCTTTTNRGRPDYWDVTYNFRGVDHQVQMTARPGSTVRVNWQGEPRSD